MKTRILTFLMLFIGTSTNAELLTGTDEQARLPFWEWRTNELSLRFVQRLPDQSRAYFAGRGFNKVDVEFIAGHCIFQTVFKNIALASTRHTLDYDLGKWDIEYNGQHYALKPREVWKGIWDERTTMPAQMIAFEWSLLPTQQHYLPADYNWGMTVYPLPHGAVFDLHLVWQVDGKPQQATIKNMQCAKDVYIAPKVE
jgi:hypothetical protein